MDVCKTYEHCASARARPGYAPLSMPSAPSRMAASKLASVFSGKRDEACGRLAVSPPQSARRYAFGGTTHPAMAPAVCMNASSAQARDVEQARHVPGKVLGGADVADVCIVARVRER